MRGRAVRVSLELGMQNLEIRWYYYMLIDQLVLVDSGIQQMRSLK